MKVITFPLSPLVTLSLSGEPCIYCVPSTYRGFKAPLEERAALVQWIFSVNALKLAGSWGWAGMSPCVNPPSPTVLSVTIHRIDFYTENLATKPFTGWIPTEKFFFPFLMFIEGFFLPLPDRSNTQEDSEL